VCALHVPARTNLCTNNRTRVIVITCKLLISCVITAIILFCIIPPTLTEMRAIYWNVRACNGYAESKSHSLNGCVLVLTCLRSTTFGEEVPSRWEKGRAAAT
jgi:hypothetical protein